MRVRVYADLEVPDQDRADDICTVLSPLLSFMGEVHSRPTWTETDPNRPEGFPADLLGTLSHGTHRAEDLVPAFGGALGRLDYDKYHQVFSQYHDWADELEVEGELINALFDALDELAPEGYYFGALEGDGSDYGFWQSESNKEEEKTVSIQSIMAEITLCPKCREAYKKSDGHVCALDTQP